MPTFTRGIWQAVGTNSCASQVWTDPNPASPTFGQNVGQIKGDSAAIATNLFDPWVSGDYDTARDEICVLLPGGDQDFSTNEVIVFSMADLTWHRRVDPTVGAIPPKGYYGTGGTFGPFPGIGGGNPAYWNDSSNVAPWNSGNAWRTPINTYPTNAVGATDLYTGLTNQHLYPNGRHTYDAVCFMGAPVNKYFLWGGAGPVGSGTVYVPIEYDPATFKYEMMTSEMVDPFNTNVPAIGPLYNQLLGPTMCWDSDRRRVVTYPTDRLIAYDPLAARGSRLSVIGPNEGGGGGVINYSTMFYDSRRKRVCRFGYNTWGAAGFTYWDFSGGPTTGVGIVPPLTGDITPTTAVNGSFNAPGAIYDPVGDQYILYTGFDPNALYFMNPNTWVTTRINYVGGSNATVVSTFTGGGKGNWKRLAYSPTYDVIVLAASAANANNVFVFGPARTVPALMCSDLASGNRTGNPDTAFGQTANVDGVYVTVYGFNLGAATDTVGVTVGGTACTIIDRGDCTAARSPALLKNQYMNGQMVVFQLNHACPLGAQSIEVTVNGQVSTSTNLPFTVLGSGIIRIVGSGAQAQVAMDAMVGGDVTYVTTGATLPGGLGLNSNTVTPSGQLALGAYPGATVTFGSAASGDGIQVLAGGGGNNCTFFKLNIRGLANPNGPQAVTLRENARLVGCNVQAPGAGGSSGAFGLVGNNLLCGANEFTNCGVVGGPDDQYHIVYRGARGDQVTRIVEGPFRGTMNYIHDNNSATRAFNIFSGVSLHIGNNASGDTTIDHNVIVNQQWAAVGLLEGAVGTNSIHDNLFVRCGLNTGGPSNAAGAAGLQLRSSYPSDWTGPTSPISISVYGNTFVDCGDTSSTQRGDYRIVLSSGYTLSIRNNIHYQANGIQYLSNDSDSLAVAPALRSNNLWFGAGAAPSFDTSPATGDPLFVSVAANNYRLQTSSPARGTGAALAITDTDLDGVARPSSTAWDIGAFQLSTITTPAPVLVALSPASCLPGAATFTLTIFADPAFPFVTGSQIFWDGLARTTTFVNSQQCTITVPAADVAVAGAHLVTATNPGSSSSNSLQFNVSLGPVTLSLSWLGKLRDRVGQGPTALAADGVFDACIQATVSNLQGRTITALDWSNLTIAGQWNTRGGPFIFVCGTALTLDGAYLNNPVTMAVNFAVADGGTFVMFLSDVTPPAEFAVGTQLRLTMTISDGSTVQATVTVSSTVPFLSSIVPNTMTIGNPAFQLQCNGTNFVTGCTVLWNGNSRATTFVSSTVVQATVLATDLLPPPQTALVSVQNPDLATTNALPFTTTFAQQTGIFVGVVM